jgi:hypothetical protein
VAHGFSGNRAEMEIFAAQARAIDGNRDTVEMITLANGVALYHLGEGQLPEALDALDRAMDVLRAAGGARDFPGRWALLRTVTDADGTRARGECRRLSSDTAMSRATLRAADAVAAGLEGGDAASIFAVADRALGRIESGFTRKSHLASPGQLLRLHRGQGRVERHRDPLRTRPAGRQDRDPVHPYRTGPRVRVL